ncbi:hypothetical protein LZC95_30235 [Pendulispora brunnea]|uniref:Tubby C-terminal-like domain-containing protein n=1 Tax=Pendulispora brunnea TaxID=2905690 RepID=A0ABZ2JW77_9BACT
MSQFVVTQRFMALATNYDVTQPGSNEVLMTVKGALMRFFPSFSLVEETGASLATLRGNFTKTRFRIRAANGHVLASLHFPAVAVEKKLSLYIGDTEYTANAGMFRGVFQCKDASGSTVLEIFKVRSMRDRFSVVTKDGIDCEVGLLAAVAIHSRFFEMA